MGLSKSFVAALAIGTTVLTGCATYQPPAQRTVDYVPPQAEPQSCRDLRRYDSQLAQQQARGNSRLLNGIIGGAIGAATGNDSTRDAAIGAIVGAGAGELYTRSQQNAARSQLKAQCDADINALRQPGGVCVWDSRANETTRVINGRPVEVFQGDARRTIGCQGIGNGGPNGYDPNL